MPLIFRKLNLGWNAEPNAPSPLVRVSGRQVCLRFYLNCFIFECTKPEEQGEIAFDGCSRWRLGAPDDEQWFAGKCRYSSLAPDWGEFYEIEGDDPERDTPADWCAVGPPSAGERHFLFYLRDNTFECIAKSWDFGLIR